MLLSVYPPNVGKIMKAREAILHPLGHLPRDSERLKQEEFLFLSAAGPYRGLPESERILPLVVRIEEHVSIEHTSWFKEAGRVTAAKGKDGA
jgi:hypothetical protein